MSDEPAHAVGSLESTPFVDLLVHAFDHRLTGTLVLEEPSGSRHGVYFEAGLPRKAKTADSVAPLGEVLVEAGVISERVHKSTLSRALEEHQLHGQVLLEDGLISEQALAHGLREQLLRQMLWLFERPLGTRFGYFDGSNFLENWGAEPVARVSMMEILWRGLRDHARPDEIDAVLARLGDRPIVLREDMPLDYFYFMGSDRDVVELLSQRPQQLSELLSTAPSLRAVIERVVCLLLLSRSVDLGTRSLPPLGLEASVEKSPWTRPPPPPDPVEENEPSFALDDQPPVSSAPVPVLEPDLGENDEDEVAVEVVPPSRPDDERQMMAAAAFERAERLMANGHVARAEEEARTAVEAVPNQAEYVALAAWIAALKPGADVSHITFELKRALRLAENNVRVHWYRGLVLQHLGRHEYALREFRIVLELDPRHLDAARQVRVYEMRLEQSPKGRPSLAPEPPPGALGWLRRKR